MLMDPMGWEVSQLSAPSILYYGPYLPLFTALTINCPTYFTKFYVLIDVFIFLSLLEQVGMSFLGFTIFLVARIVYGSSGAHDKYFLN